MNGIFNYQIPGRAVSYNADQYQRSGNYGSPSHSFGSGFNLHNQFSGIFNLINSFIGHIHSPGGQYTQPGQDPFLPTPTLAVSEDGHGWKPTRANIEDGHGWQEKPALSTRAGGEEDGVFQPVGVTQAHPEDGGGDYWKGGPLPVVEPPAMTLAFPEEGGTTFALGEEDGGGYNPVEHPKETGPYPGEVSSLALHEEDGGGYRPVEQRPSPSDALGEDGNGYGTGGSIGHGRVDVPIIDINQFLIDGKERGVAVPFPVEHPKEQRPYPIDTWAGPLFEPIDESELIKKSVEIPYPPKKSQSY